MQQVPLNEAWSVSVLQRIIQPDWMCLDVGANDGTPYTELFIEKLGPKGRVLAIEPGPKPYQRLVANIHTWLDVRGPQQPTVCTERRGVGATTQQLEVGYHDCWTLLPVGDPKVAEKRSKEFDTFTMQIDRLDSLVGTQRVDVINLDVDGYELAALQGGHNILSAQKPLIVIELAATCLEWLGTSVEEVVNFLHKCGYTFYFTDDDGPLTDVEQICNCVPRGASTTSRNAVCVHVDRLDMWL